jgi:phosphate transport system permease protein
MEKEAIMSSQAMLEQSAPTAPTTKNVAAELAWRPRVGERIIEGLLFAAGAISILTTAGIVFVLVRDALDFFILPEVTLVEFFTSTRWLPQAGEFGIWPLLTATLVISAIAMLVGIPLGFFTAIYLSEYASPRFRATLKPVLEILAGVPTVVLGFFALTFVTPALRSIFGDDVVKIYNMASAGIVVGILTVPLIASLSEDALHAVPDSLRQASFGLGATRMETSLRVVAPAALSGISAAVVVAASRAVGETMIVALAAGAGPNFTFNPFLSAETMTGYMVRISGGDISYGSIDYQSIFAVGLVVFVLTLLLNILSGVIVRRFREVYE